MRPFRPARPRIRCGRSRWSPTKPDHDARPTGLDRHHFFSQTHHDWRYPVRILLAHEALTEASPRAVARTAARGRAKLDPVRVVVAAVLAAASPGVFADSPDDSSGETVVISAQRLNDARSSIETQTGASTYTIDSQAILAMPGGANNQLNQVLLQAPDVVQDSFGQLHVRADHNDLQYRLNGIILPEGISVFSQTLSPWLISSLKLITGALPAEYGLRTAGIIDLSTNSGSLQPGGEVSLYGGSHSTFQPSAEFGGSYGQYTYYVSADYKQSNLGIDSPDGSSTPL